MKIKHLMMLPVAALCLSCVKEPSLVENDLARQDLNSKLVGSIVSEDAPSRETSRPSGQMTHSTVSHSNRYSATHLRQQHKGTTCTAGTRRALTKP